MHAPTEMVPPAEQLTPPSETNHASSCMGSVGQRTSDLLDDFKDSHAAHFA